MGHEPMLRWGEALVVHDGPCRLIWKQTGAARWTPWRVWPDATEAAVVNEAVSRGAVLLIIVDRRPEPVHVLVEELTGAPPEIADLVASVDGDVAELRVSQLGWLPTHLVERGQRFLSVTAATTAHLPTLLHPALILQPPHSSENVWFGLRMAAAHWSNDELMAVVEHLAATGQPQRMSTSEGERSRNGQHA